MQTDFSLQLKASPLRAEMTKLKNC